DVVQVGPTRGLDEVLDRGALHEARPVVPQVAPHLERRELEEGEARGLLDPEGRRLGTEQRGAYCCECTRDVDTRLVLARIRELRDLQTPGDAQLLDQAVVRLERARVVELEDERRATAPTRQPNRHQEEGCSTLLATRGLL